MTRVLIVDDHAPNREYLASLLGYGGYAVIEAADGAEALETTRREQPDLVVTDILMPTMDGYELVRRLRGDAAIKDIPVVFCTAVYHEIEARKLAGSCGVSQVLIKPCEPEIVLRTVERALADRTPPPVPDPGEFDREHLRVVSDKLTRTIDELGIANKRFGALIDINLQLASERRPVRLLQGLCVAARELIGARYALLAVGGRDDATTRHLLTAGFDPGLAGSADLRRVDEGRIGIAYRERRAARLHNPSGAPADAGLPAGHPPVHSMLAAPIVSLKYIYGWICLTERMGLDEFTEEDEHLLTILGAQVGRIYENGDLYHEIQESEQKFRQLTDHIQEVFFLNDADMTHLLYVSPAYENIWGRSVADLYDNPREWLDAVHPEDKPFATAMVREARTTGYFDYEYRIQRPDGEERWIEARGFPVRDEQGRVYRVAGIAEDITGRKVAEAQIRSLNRMYAVLSSFNGAIVRIHDRRALFKEACRILVEQGRFPMAWIGMLDEASGVVVPAAWQGPADDYEVVSSVRYSSDESVPEGRTTVGRAVRDRTPAYSIDLRSGADLPAVFRDLAGRGYRRIISLPLLSGESCLGVLVLYSKEPGLFSDEEMRLLLELAGDISFALDYISNEERLEYLAYRDPLTGLANRAMLLRRLGEAIDERRSGQRPFALLLVNINNFSYINNTLGHNNGDLVLEEIARRVVSVMWEKDVVAGLGADEFGILVPVLADKQDIEVIVGKITGALKKRLLIQNLPINVEARLGVALYPDHGESSDLLWQRAHIALRAAKELDRSWVVYESAIDHHDPVQLALLGGLRSAMDQNDLVLHYQPNIDLAAGRVQGFEALLRWQHPERGLIFPDEFIPLAEQTDLINPLTIWVLANALRQGHIWHNHGLPLEIAVNISARNLQDPDLCGEILEQARSARFPVNMLRLEVTESAIMADPERSRAVLQELSDAGIPLAADDFGVGQSSLAYIRDLPITSIKIDKSFVMGFEEPRNAAIVRTAVDLGRNLGLTVTAEGVEDEATYRALRALRCDTAQGYYFSRPMPADRLMAWARHSPWKYAPD